MELREALAIFLKKECPIASGADAWTAYILPVEYQCLICLICVPLNNENFAKDQGVLVIN